MKTIDERMVEFTSFNGQIFIRLGIIKDDFKRYIVFIDPVEGKIYIEEIWAKRFGTNFEMYLRKIENDEEWKTVFEYITTKTTILSKKRLKKLLNLRSVTVNPKLTKKWRDFLDQFKEKK